MSGGFDSGVPGSDRGEDNVDPAEVRKFAAASSRWWDPESEFKPLHALNPVRTSYVRRRAELAGARVLDVGCGGGLFSEALAACGARVTGIDAAAEAIDTARLHLLESGLQADYTVATAEAFAGSNPAGFDLVVCMELIEHVPDPASLVEACARLVRPGGDVVFSTLNRTLSSFGLAIVAAEYVLGWVPRGTHDYASFIRPSELDAWARRAGLSLRDVTGVTYDPLTRRFALSRNVSVNYLAWFAAPDE